MRSWAALGLACAAAGGVASAQTVLHRDSTLARHDWALLAPAPKVAQPWRGDWRTTGAETDGASRLVLDPFSAGGPRAAFDWRQAVGTGATFAYQSELRVVGLSSGGPEEAFNPSAASMRQMNRLSASWRLSRHWTTQFSSRWTESRSLDGEAGSGEFQQQWDTTWTVRSGVRLRSSLQRTLGFSADGSSVAADRQSIGWAQDVPRLPVTVSFEGITETRGPVGRPAENRADRIESRLDWRAGSKATVGLSSNLFRQVDALGRPREEGLHLRSKWVQPVGGGGTFEFETHWQDRTEILIDRPDSGRGSREFRSSVGLRLGQSGSFGLDSHWREQDSGPESKLLRDELRLRLSPEFPVGAGLSGRVDLLYGFRLGSAGSLAEPERRVHLSIGGRW